MWRINTIFCLANLTIHFSVGLPFVVPASEGLTVVLSTLLGPEVHRVNGARPSVTQLVETAGAWAKFTIVLRSTTWQGKKSTYREKNNINTDLTCFMTHFYWCVNEPNVPDMLELLNFFFHRFLPLRFQTMCFMTIYSVSDSRKWQVQPPCARMHCVLLC